MEGAKREREDREEDEEVVAMTEEVGLHLEEDLVKIGVEDGEGGLSLGDHLISSFPFPFFSSLLFFFPRDFME